MQYFIQAYSLIFHKKKKILKKLYIFLLVFFSFKIKNYILDFFPFFEKEIAIGNEL